MDIVFISVDNYYKNGISTMIGRLDEMLAELTLGEEQVAKLEQAKLKYTCASLMIDKELYQEAFVMESEGALDAADVIESIGLPSVASKLREMHNAF